MTLLLIRAQLVIGVPSINYSLFTDMEVGGVEPPSETASTKLLRVYLAFDLARDMPTSGLILKHPFGYTCRSARAESPTTSPAEVMPRRLSRRLLPRHRGRN